MAFLALAFTATGLIALAQPVSTIPRLILSVESTLVPLVAVSGPTWAVLSRRILGHLGYSSALRVNTWSMVTNGGNKMPRATSARSPVPITARCSPPFGCRANRWRPVSKAPPEGKKSLKFRTGWQTTPPCSNLRET